MYPSRAISESTRFRRARARSGFRRGLYADGPFGSAASVAASVSVRRETLLPKRSRLAASTPYTPLPR
jgi:hypothetical protein